MWSVFYISSILLVNWLFVALPVLHTPWGEWSVANILVGFVFVLRDFAQRQLGHWILAATALGGLLTWGVVTLVTPPDSFIAPGTLALASVTAFMISETVDWVVYTVTKRPLHDRVLWSCASSAPVDTFVFLSMIHFLNPASFALETSSKILGGLAVWWILKYRVLKISSVG